MDDKLLKASDVKEYFKRVIFGADKKIDAWVDSIPAVDAVEVVRCRECIHRPTVSDHDEIGGFKYEFPDYDCPCNCDDGFYSWAPRDDWFCAAGQRREEDT